MALFSLTGHFYIKKNISIVLAQEFIYSGAFITLISLSKNLNRNERMLDETEKDRRKPLIHLFLCQFSNKHCKFS